MLKKLRHTISNINNGSLRESEKDFKKIIGDYKSEIVTQLGNSASKKEQERVKFELQKELLSSRRENLIASLFKKSKFVDGNKKNNTKINLENRMTQIYGPENMFTSLKEFEMLPIVGDEINFGIDLINLYNFRGNIKSEVAQVFLSLMQSVHIDEVDNYNKKIINKILGNKKSGGYGSFDRKKFDFLLEPENHIPHDLALLIAYDAKAAGLILGQTINTNLYETLLSQYSLNLNPNESPEKSFLLDDLIIAPRFQRKGLGTLAINTILPLLEDQNYSKTYFEIRSFPNPNHDSYNLFEKFAMQNKLELKEMGESKPYKNHNGFKTKLYELSLANLT